jgi:glutamate dehydrogenase/leucine dehydrogenase
MPECADAGHPEVETLLVEKLKTVDAFVVFDFEDAPCSAGVIRSAPKILVDGATWLARSQTYQFAAFEVQAGGASGGINAAPDGRADAVASFVAEVKPWVASHRLVPDAAKGVNPNDFAPLREADPRPSDYWERAEELMTTGIGASADLALGGLDGRTVAVEGFDGLGVRIAADLVARGGRVVAVGTAAGTAVTPDGFDPEVLGAQWHAMGPDLVRELEPEPGPAGAVLGAEVDVLVCGSRAGVIDHGVAAGCAAKAVVPSGPIPVTAKGLAVLRRAGVCVLPDFVTTAGAFLGGLAPVLVGIDSSAAVSSRDEVQANVTAVLAEVIDHEQGPVLGACHRAEAFLRTWRSDLPFGRPLA